MRCAPATATVPVPPSTFPKVTAHEHLQTTSNPLRHDAGTRDTLSEGRASMGRAYRLGPRAGEELAAHGLRLPDPVGRLRLGAGLAIRTRDRGAVGGAGGQSWTGADRSACERRLSADRSADRFPSRPL